jgi:glutamine amidotransferase
MSRITIIDYGSGNLHSISKALDRLGAETEVTDSIEKISEAEKLVLPGVGHFGDAMTELNKRNLVEPLRAYASSGRPFLGVCVGLQLFMESSDEAPEIEGLGLIKGNCEKFDPSAGKVPHMGWNKVTVRRRCPVLQVREPGTGEDPLQGAPYFYFVHSYYAAPEDPSVIAASTHYGGDFCAVIQKDNLQATQFHPEKSQKAGLRLLSNFIAMPAAS